MIIIAGWFDAYGGHCRLSGKKEYVASHGVDTETGRNVIVSGDHPSKLGAEFHEGMGEWVIE